MINIQKSKNKAWISGVLALAICGLAQSFNPVAADRQEDTHESTILPDTEPSLYEESVELAYFAPDPGMTIDKLPPNARAMLDQPLPITKKHTYNTCSEQFNIQGIPDAYAKKVDEIEQRGHAAGSKAYGKYQFIPKTWISLVRKHSPRHRHKSDAEILKLRKKDGRFMDYIFCRKTKDDRRILQKYLKRPASWGEVFLAHHMGRKGAAMLIKYPNHKAVWALKRANKSLKQSQLALKRNRGRLGQTSKQFTGWKIKRFDHIGPETYVCTPPKCGS